MTTTHPGVARSLGRAAPASRPSASVRRANTEAQKLTGRAYVSHSQLSLFRGCPRKFAFTYIEHVQPDHQPVSLLLGGAVHAAMELHFRRQLEGLSSDAGDLMHAFMASWQSQRDKVGDDVPIRFNKDESMGDVIDLAQRIITAFLASSASQPHGRILGIEEELTVTLAHDLPDLLAKVDLVTQTDTPAPGALHVVDWKTSRSRWTSEKAMENAEQLRLYHRSVSRMADGLKLPVSLHFVVVTKAKSPVVQVLDVPQPDAATSGSGFQQLTESVRSVWSAIKAGHDYPSPSPMQCSTCAFKSRCPAFAHQAAPSRSSVDESSHPQPKENP